MCNIEEKELIEIEQMIFKFLLNSKWVGNVAPDRIKRYFFNVILDIKILNLALKVKQFVRSMTTSHPVQWLQKYQLEQIGYYEYFKCEYVKICKNNSIISAYQSTCNKLTDHIQNMCSNRPLPDPSKFSDSISVIASTDILEYFHQKAICVTNNYIGMVD